MAIDIPDEGPRTTKTVGVNTLDDFFAYTQPRGSLAQAGSNLLYGINQLNVKNTVPINKDNIGLVFFTRPMLNMSKLNLMRNRFFHPLLTTEAKSVQRYIRCILDPYLIYDSTSGVTCPMVNNKLAFIPLLSNSLIKLTGWPDIVAPTFTSKQGIRKEQWSMVDGITEVNETFDMDATFQNMAEDPIRLMFKTWVKYESYVYDGQLNPYYGFEARNEIDYTTRIYRLVLDSTNTFVKRIACTIASFPVNDPTGGTYDYDSGSARVNTDKETNIRFRCMGARYDDAIIVKWFNRAAGYANPDLLIIAKNGFDSSKVPNYTVVPRELSNYFNYIAYPLINENTLALEWWVDTTTLAYKTAVSKLKDSMVPNPPGIIPSMLKQAMTTIPFRAPR